LIDVAKRDSTREERLRYFSISDNEGSLTPLTPKDDIVLEVDSKAVQTEGSKGKPTIDGELQGDLSD
jgi:hypothetical protein